MNQVLMTFSAGALGALANSLVVWLFGQYGINQAVGVMIAPALSAAWLYPRIVWGGLWGFLFLLRIFNRGVVMRGLLFSLAPSAVQLLYFFPHQGQGLGGLYLGLLTPLMVLLFNGVWGVTTALVLKKS